MTPSSRPRIRRAVAVAALLALAAGCSAGGAPAAKVDGDEISQRSLKRELRALADNEVLAPSIGAVAPGSVPTGLASSWLSSIVVDRIISGELGRRGAKVRAAEQGRAEQLVRKGFGPGYDSLPGWLQDRQIARTARILALARDEGIDVQGDQQALARLVARLARAADVTVDARYGCWTRTGTIQPPRPGGAAAERAGRRACG